VDVSDEAAEFFKFLQSAFQFGHNDCAFFEGWLCGDLTAVGGIARVDTFFEEVEAVVVDA
jgi:hypothetical protein